MPALLFYAAQERVKETFVLMGKVIYLTKCIDRLNQIQNAQKRQAGRTNGASVRSKVTQSKFGFSDSTSCGIESLSNLEVRKFYKRRGAIGDTPFTKRANKGKIRPNRINGGTKDGWQYC